MGGGWEAGRGGRFLVFFPHVLKRFPTRPNMTRISATTRVPPLFHHHKDTHTSSTTTTYSSLHHAYIFQIESFPPTNHGKIHKMPNQTQNTQILRGTFVSLLVLLPAFNQCSQAADCAEKPLQETNMNRLFQNVGIIFTCQNLGRRCKTCLLGPKKRQYPPHQEELLAFPVELQRQRQEGGLGKWVKLRPISGRRKKKKKKKSTEE